VTIDWTLQESVEAKLRVMVKGIGIFVAATIALLLVVAVGRRRPGP
jgi:hypothetical protein